MVSGPYKLNTNMLNKFSDDIAKIYETTILVNEVSQKFVDEVKDAVADRELPFQDIFGDAVRIVIPFDTVNSDTVISDILSEISKIKDYAGVDMKKGEVTRKIKLDPKYGGGEKEQKIAIGRAVANLKIDEDKKKKFLDFLATYRENLAEPKEYSIVISRNPIDVLRMGELGVRDNLESCHAQGGSYFKCAIQEAKSGGGIAYVVRTEDIEALSEEELQYDEIFEDKKREVDGVHAISRLRIRRYDTHNDEDDIEASLAVPTHRIYGKNIPGFFQAVANFLKMSSRILNNTDYIVNKYKEGKIVRYGGTYTDVYNDTVFNDMFPGDFKFYDSLIDRERVVEGEPEYDGDDDAENLADIMDTELQEIDDRFNLEYSNHGFEVHDDNDGPYYTAWASIRFGRFEFSDNVDDDITFNPQDLMRFNPDGDQEWQKRTPYEFKGKVSEALIAKKFIVDLDRFLPSGIDIDDVRDIDIDTQGFIRFNLNTDDLGFDTSDYRDILDTLEAMDNNYEEIFRAINKALAINGYLTGVDVDRYTALENPEEFDETLENFTYDPDDDTLSLNVTIGNVRDVNTGSASRPFKKMLHSYLQKYYKPSGPKESPNQLTFAKFFESYDGQGNLYNIVDIICPVNTSTRPRISCDLQITFHTFNKTAADISKFLDDHVDDVINMVRLAFYITNDETEGVLNVLPAGAERTEPAYKSSGLYKTYSPLLK
jgi:hypothetical protein